MADTRTSIVDVTKPLTFVAAREPRWGTKASGWVNPLNTTLGTIGWNLAQVKGLPTLSHTFYSVLGNLDLAPQIFDIYAARIAIPVNSKAKFYSDWYRVPKGSINELSIKLIMRSQTSTLEPTFKVSCGYEFSSDTNAVDIDSKGATNDAIPFVDPDNIIYSPYSSFTPHFVLDYLPYIGVNPETTIINRLIHFTGGQVRTNYISEFLDASDFGAFREGENKFSVPYVERPGYGPYWDGGIPLDALVINRDTTYEGPWGIIRPNTSNDVYTRVVINVDNDTDAEPGRNTAGYLYLTDVELFTGFEF